MQRILITVILFAILLCHVSLCRRGTSSGKRYRKYSGGSNTKSYSTSTTMSSQGNLCYGGQMLNDLEMQMKDTEFYKANWKTFPDGLYYPNCASALESGMTRGVLVRKCVNFTISSSKLNLSAGKYFNNQRDIVMWQVIHHLCANESCGLPCSSTGSLHYLDPWLILGLVGCLTLFRE